MQPPTSAAAAAPRGGRQWAWRELAALAAVGTVLLALFGWLIGAFDLESGLRAGRALLSGRSPYSPLTSAVFRSGHAFVYPYLVAWAFVPLAALPTSAAVAVFTGLSAAAIVAACRLLGRPGWLPAALVLSSSTTIVGLQMGTVNALLLLGVAVAWSQRSRWVVVGLAVAATAVAKLFLLPLVAWLVLTRRWKAAGLAVATLATVLGAGWAVGPLGLHGYSGMLRVLQGHEAATSWSLTSFFDSLGAGAATSELLAVAAAAVTVAVGAVRAWRSGDERNLFAATVIASLLATPIMWSSYLLVLAAVVLVVATDDRAVAALAAASWLVVTPDVASLPRVIAGMALTGILAGVALWRPVAGTSWHPATRLRGVLGDPARAVVRGVRGRWRPATGAAAAAAGGVVALLALVPPPVRSALPALLLMAAAGLQVARITGG